MKVIYKFITALRTHIFGSLHWDIPPWLRFVLTYTKTFLCNLSKRYALHRRRLHFILLFLLITLVFFIGAFFWMSSLPQPQRLFITSTAISPTLLEDNAMPDELLLRFSGSAAKLDDIGNVVLEGIEMDPPIAGVWRWKNDKVLAFRINKDWPIEEYIKIKFDASLFPPHIKLDSYHHKVTTPKFTLEIKKLSFYQHPEKPQEKKVIAEVHFSHPVDTNLLEKKTQFILEQDSKEKGKVLQKQKVDFTITYDSYKGIAFLHTENINIPQYDSKMFLQIDRGVKSSRGGSALATAATKSVKIPGILTYFTFTNAFLDFARNKESNPEQILVLETSAVVSPVALSNYLEVYRLPRDKPKTPGNNQTIKQYQWRYASEVTKQVLDSSTKIDISPIPTALAYGTSISYKYEQPAGSYLYIRIKKDLTSFGGYKLPEDIGFVVRVPEFPQELAIMSKGALLSLSGDKKLPILARNLTHVEFNAQKLLPGQIAHFITQSSGTLGKPRFKYSFGMSNIAKSHILKKALPKVDKGKAQYSYFDFTNVIADENTQPRGLFYVKAKGYHRDQIGPQDQRFILITDLGIIAKQSVGGGYDLFVQSVATGEPVANATIQVMGRNGLPVMQRNTDHTGHVQFPPFSHTMVEKLPVAFVVMKDNDLSFMPINSHVSQMNYMRYDVGGVFQSNRNSIIDAYLFSDRGIYRPGDTVNIGYIVKNTTNLEQDLSHHHAVLYVNDPKGNRIIKQNLTLNRLGLQQFAFNTKKIWATGNYSVSLHLKLSENDTLWLASTDVRVEEFIPDRMRITTSFSQTKKQGWVQPTDLLGKVSLQTLFGIAASARRIKATIQLKPAYKLFKGFNDWQFYDPIRSDRSFTEQLGEQTTDANGNTAFRFDLDKYTASSYLLSFTAEGFEAEGGRSVIATNSLLISPLDYIVGYKAEGNLSLIKKGADITVELMALNADLKRINVPNLTKKLIEYRKISTLIKQRDGTFKYETVSKEYEVSRTKLSLLASGSKVKIDSSKGGEFALAIFNPEGVELNRIRYSIAEKSNETFTLETDATLHVTLNKKDYDPGETIELHIKTPYDGAGLITIEREKVFSYQWFKVNNKSTIQHIKIPDNLENNAYVNVTFVRSLASDEIFMSPLSTYIAPFSINKDQRINEINLHVPQLVRPGEKLDMLLSSKIKGKAILFAVNEGILQFANYQTPDPLSSFYKKQALEVETRQILDQILPEFSKLHLKQSSEAGGESAATLLGKNLNPFTSKREKPVVYWSGIIDIGPDPQAYSYEVPDYFSGELRVMAVAVSKEAMDATSSSSVVKGHFVIEPNIPSFIAPGDSVRLAVTVYNNVEGSGENADILLKLMTSNNMKLDGNDSVHLSVDEGSEATATFVVKASDILGNADFTFVASLDEKQSKRKVSTAIRPAITYNTTVSAGHILPGEKKVVEVPRHLYKEFYENSLVVSHLPTAIIPSLQLYLEKYPYGCTEQIISKGFPSVILSAVNNTITKNEVAKQVTEIGEMLVSRQLPSNGFAKWPGSLQLDYFHTIYAAHFLTEARDLGFAVPEDLLQSVLSLLKEYTIKEPQNLNMARLQAYAAYIIARNGIIVTQSLTLLENWLSGYKTSIKGNDILALYIAASYKLMQADDKANALMQQFDYSDQSILANADYRYGVFDNNIRQATYLTIVAKHFPKFLITIDDNKLNDLVNTLAESYNTTSSAMAIFGLASYAKAIGGHSIKGVNAYAVKGDQFVPLSFVGEFTPKVNIALDVQKVKITNDSNTITYFALSQSGFDRNLPTIKQDAAIEVSRQYVDKNGQRVKAIALGEEVTVELKLRTVGKDYAANIAVVDLLPGGFEVVLDSVKRDASFAEYADIREDRLIIFGHLTKDVQTYSYKIKATNRGRYAVAPIYAESMYDQTIRSKGITQSITVE